MNEQPLELFRAPPEPPENADARLVFNVLRGRRWVHKGVLLRDLAGPDYLGTSEQAERRLREAASNSRGLIVSWQGSPGYCRIDEATGEEVQQAEAQHGKQAEAETRRRLEIHNAYHRYGKPA